MTQQPDTSTYFAILTDNPHVIYSASLKNGRWYWRKTVNGQIAYDNNVRFRSSARRAIKRDIRANGMKAL